MYPNPTHCCFCWSLGVPTFKANQPQSNQSSSSEELPNPIDLPIDLPYDLPNSWGEKQHATCFRGVAMERDSKREKNLKVWKNWRFQVGILCIECAWGIHPTKTIWMMATVSHDSFVLLMFTYYTALPLALYIIRASNSLLCRMLQSCQSIFCLLEDLLQRSQSAQCSEFQSSTFWVVSILS